MKPRTELRRMSAKRQAKLEAAGTRVFSTLTPSAPPKEQKKSKLSRSPGTRTGMMRRPTKRKPRAADETARIYGPDEFRDWLHRQPCAVCGASAVFTEQAHVGNGGMSKKAPWTQTIPLCGIRRGILHGGCHREIHQHGVKSFEAKHGVTLLDLAARTQTAWAAESARRAQGGGRE